MFSQVIIAMAHHQYLAHEGGNMLIEFIVRQCGINTALVPKVSCLSIRLFVCLSLMLKLTSILSKCLDFPFQLYNKRLLIWDL